MACSTTHQHSSLTEFLKDFGEWTVSEKAGDGRREIDWRAGSTQMGIVWDAAKNRVLSQTVDGQPLPSGPRYTTNLKHR